MWIDRGISKKIHQLSKFFPALVLTGSRQTGKTSLLKKLFPEHTYVSLDIPSMAEQADESPDTFLKNHPPPLLVDEVQYAPKLFRHLKQRIDQKREKSGQFILTGSQKFTLMKEVSDSLAGRCAVIELEGLSREEILGHQSSDLEALILRGSFPQLWKDTGFPVSAFFSSYLSTYLERDVRQLINVVSLRDFERFIRVCASRNGQVLDKSAIANEVGVSSKAINDWVSVLVASGQIQLLEPWYGNFGKRLIKSPKLYFSDTGLLCYLLAVDSNTVTTSPFIGSIWESFVYAELRKQLAKSDSAQTLWFYRDNQQKEIDFLLIGGGKANFMEVKWKEIPQKRDAETIEKITEYIEQRKVKEFSDNKGFVICRTPSDHPLSAKTLGVNVDYLNKLVD